MDVAMPQLGETVTEGTITKWCKGVGDRVEADDVLFEVSTDKVDSEVPSPGAGVLTEIRVPVGETVPVGTVLAVLGGSAAPAPVPAPVAAAPIPVAPAAPAPAAPAPAAPAPAAPAVPEVTAAAPPTPPSPRVTSPVVRRLLAEHGLRPDDVTGTGDGGRITRRDVQAVVTARGPAPAAAPAPVAPVAPVAESPDVAVPVEAPAPPGRVEPLSVMRRRIGEHMVASQSTSAHAYTSVEVDFERVVQARDAHRVAWKEREGFSLTFLPFIVRAVSDVIDDFPVVNASIVADDLVLHPALHLSVAVDLDFQGLITPVVRDADGKRLRLIAREIHDLATRARSKKLLPGEIQGGTFTITNPGPFGTYQTLAIINQPQVAILATDGIAKRAVVMAGPDGGDVIAVRHLGLLTIGWDHRAFDGAYAAAFLAAVREVIEHRDWETELE
jgi:2-oxoglutarate dehydrogenase E2 component (dihydrolipoamide succinyltransferase)